MKPFEEMTKAEKMKVLEQDYLERKLQETAELYKREKRKEKLKRLGIASIGTLLVLMIIALFVGFVVMAVTEPAGTERTKSIVGAVIFGIVNVGILYGLIYHSLKS